VVLLAALTRDDLTSASDTPTASKNALEVNISTTALDAVVDDNALGEVIFDPLMACAYAGIEESNIDLLVYPNPVNAILSITIPENENVNSISIYSLNGELVQFESATSNGTIQLDVTALVSGVYFVTVQGDNFLINEKIIKQD